MKIKSVMILIFLIALGGCSSGNNVSTQIENFKTQCVDGVTYYIFAEFAGNNGYGYMAPKFNRDGKIDLCNTQTKN